MKNLDEKSSQQVWHFISFFIVIKYSRLLWFVMTFTSTPVSFSLGFHYSKYLIIANSFLS